MAASSASSPPLQPLPRRPDHGVRQAAGEQWGSEPEPEPRSANETGSGGAGGGDVRRHGDGSNGNNSNSARTAFMSTTRR